MAKQVFITIMNCAFYGIPGVKFLMGRWVSLVFMIMDGSGNPGNLLISGIKDMAVEFSLYPSTKYLQAHPMGYLKKNM